MIRKVTDMLLAYVFGILIIHTCAPTVVKERSLEKREVLRTNEDVEMSQLYVHSKGKTKVFRHDGQKFDRLHEFCTWTETFHCSMLKTPAGEIPIFHHDPATDPVMGAVLAKEGQRDKKDIGLVIQELEKHPDAMFLDLGANVGIYTLTIGKTLKRKIIAVEPVIENAAKLCKSIQENELTENVTLIFNPLSDTHSEVDMMKPKTHLSASEVRPIRYDNRAAGLDPSCERFIPYNTVCLDDLLPFMTAQSAVLKVDVESYEYNVFKGGQRFLDEINVPFIIMEWEHVKRKAGANFVELMKVRGYVAHDKENSILDFGHWMSWPWDVVWRKRV